MAIADLDKQPDSVSSVLKVFGILQALGEERNWYYRIVAACDDVEKAPFIAFANHEVTGASQEGESENIL